MTTANPPSFQAPGAPGAALDRTDSDVVLIVDDVPDNLAVLHDALDESGYTVLVATHGEAALQRAAQALPDIVLLDAMMPGMDGFEVARRLKASPATAHIPIIFMTGLTETEHLVAALAALAQAVSLGYYRGILNTLDDIERSQPAHSAFVDTMRQLAKQFQFDAMGQILEQAPS